MTVEELLRKYAATRDVRVRDELIQRHTRLVKFFAARLSPGGPTRDDLVQVGYIGLISAIDRFDPTHDNSFVTYAAPTILGTMRRYIRDQTWGVKVPRRLRELGITLLKVAEEEEGRLGRPATLAELAARTGWAEERIAEAMELERLYQPLSLDAPHADAAGENAGLRDGPGADDPALLVVESRETLRDAIQALGPRQQCIIRERFFGEASQEQVAEKLGISQMHVSRLERQALRLLREILADQEP